MGQASLPASQADQHLGRGHSLTPGPGEGKRSVPLTVGSLPALKDIGIWREALCGRQGSY